MATSFVVLMLIAVSTIADGATFKQCGGTTYGKLNSLTITPDPIPLKEGKTITVNYDVTVSKTFPSEVKYELTVHKVGWFGVRIPLCKFLGDVCNGKTLTCKDIEKAQALLPDDVKNKLPKYPCPLTFGQYSKHIPFTVPKLPPIPSFIANGEYEIKLRLKNAQTGEEIACGDVSNLHIQM